MSTDKMSICLAHQVFNFPYKEKCHQFAQTFGSDVNTVCLLPDELEALPVPDLHEAGSVLAAFPGGIFKGQLLPLFPVRRQAGEICFLCGRSVSIGIFFGFLTWLLWLLADQT